jgi:hypothetical protein
MIVKVFIILATSTLNLEWCMGLHSTVKLLGKKLTVTSMLAYYNTEIITLLKSFKGQAT